MKAALLVCIIVAAMAGCVQPQTDLEQALEYLADQSAQGGDSVRTLQAAAAAGLDPTMWPGEHSIVDQVIDSGGVSTLGDTARLVHGLVMAGIDPRAFAGTDLVAQLVAYHDGDQFGDNGSIADDLWAVIALSTDADASIRALVTRTVDAILDMQDTSGGWSWNSVGAGLDETAWAIVALDSVGRLYEASSVAPALRSFQDDSGGFRTTGTSVNCQSTGLALWAASFAPGVDTEAAQTYLRSCQDDIGGYAYTPGGPPSGWVTADVVLGLAAQAR